MATQECSDLVRALVSAQAPLAAKQTADKAKLAAVNSQINDLLHIVEYLSLPANSMAKVMKKLKELYQLRRVLKEDLIVADNIITHRKDPLAELVNSDARNTKYMKEAQASFDRIIKTPL